ncbi:MAG: vWA domain-containing protein, partial [Planctomycetota bacterium]|nr:vWA domain-containing protein [Planctomycetota bacterium]
NSDRSMSDFWGPADVRSEPFFVIATEGNLRGTIALGTMNPPLQKRREILAMHLGGLALAARSGLQTSSGDLLLNNDVEDVSIDVTVRSESPVSSNGKAAAPVALPAGEASVFIRDREGRIPGTTRSLQLPLTLQQTELDFNLPGSDLAERGPILQATTLFRGNQFMQPFLLRASGGIKIAFDPYQYGPPQVTLSGPSRKRASVMFILDCSSSMSEMTDVEAPGDQRQMPRMEVAKSVLANLLEQLADRGDARVGVRFYGHRVGWNLRKPEELLRQSEYANKIPDDLVPSEDVELVLPLGRFDDVTLPRVLTPLKSVKPWGETPLYLSIINALADFTGDDANTERSIVVVTDGVNYQFNSRSPKGRADLLAALGNRNDVKIHIVGFGIPSGQRAQATREFDELATRTGGSYVLAENAASLVRALESLLGPSYYTVSDAASREIGQAQVGTSITIIPAPEHAQYYTVALDKLSDRIELAGGESAELAISRNQKQIEAVPYTKGDPKFTPLVESVAPRSTGLMIGAHRPIWMAEGVRFPVSIQHENHQFTPRPGEFWIEVTPVAEDRRPLPKYLFYDLNYEPGTSAPVLSWTAENWPEGAKQAQLQVFVKQRATPPISAVRLDELTKGSEISSQRTVEGIAGMQYRVIVRPASGSSPLQVGVVERLTADSATLGSAKFEIAPTPRRVVRRFDAENRLATHMFELSGIDLASYELRITRRSDVVANAMTLSEPAVISVSDSNNILRLPTASR